HLHAEAKPKIWNLMLSRKTCGLDFPLDATNAKTTGNQDTGHFVQLTPNSFLQGFRVNKFKVDSAIFARSSMRERLVNTLVGIPNLKVFADHGNCDSFRWANDALNKVFPTRQIGLPRFQAQQIAHQLVQTLGVKGQRHFVNCMCDIALFDYSFFRDAAEHGEFLAQIEIQHSLSTANQNLRLQPDFAQLRYAL